MQYANVEGHRLLPTPGAYGKCPQCQGDVIAKCGSVKVHHWAHKALECDPWHEPESEWHLGWKNRFPEEYQEVVVGNHRADIKTKWKVVEFQNSLISVEEIKEREQHYGDMIWVVNGHGFADRFETYYGEHGSLYFRWKHARKCWSYAKRPVLFHFPNGLFRLRNLHRENYSSSPGLFGSGNWCPFELFMDTVLYNEDFVWIKAPEPVYGSFQEIVRASLDAPEWVGAHRSDDGWRRLNERLSVTPKIPAGSNIIGIGPR